MKVINWIANNGWKLLAVMWVMAAIAVTVECVGTYRVLNGNCGTADAVAALVADTAESIRNMGK